MKKFEAIVLLSPDLNNQNIDDQKEYLSIKIFNHYSKANS